MEMDDDTLTALALREHAQTCDEVASKYSPGDRRLAWTRRAERCRELARRHEAAAKVFRASVPPTRCDCGDAMRAIGEHREGCPARGQA